MHEGWLNSFWLFHNECKVFFLVGRFGQAGENYFKVFDNFALFVALGYFNQIYIPGFYPLAQLSLEIGLHFLQYNFQIFETLHPVGGTVLNISVSHPQARYLLDHEGEDGSIAEIAEVYLFVGILDEMFSE